MDWYWIILGSQLLGGIWFGSCFYWFPRLNAEMPRCWFPFPQGHRTKKSRLGKEEKDDFGDHLASPMLADEASCFCRFKQHRGDPFAAGLKKGRDECWECGDRYDRWQHELHLDFLWFTYFSFPKWMVYYRSCGFFFGGDSVWMVPLEISILTDWFVNPQFCCLKIQKIPDSPLICSSKFLSWSLQIKCHYTCLLPSFMRRPRCGGWILCFCGWKLSMGTASEAICRYFFQNFWFPSKQTDGGLAFIWIHLWVLCGSFWINKSIILYLSPSKMRSKDVWQSDRSSICEPQPCSLGTLRSVGKPGVVHFIALKVHLNESPGHRWTIPSSGHKRGAFSMAKSSVNGGAQSVVWWLMLLVLLLAVNHSISAASVEWRSKLEACSLHARLWTKIVHSFGVFPKLMVEWSFALWLSSCNRTWRWNICHL